MLMCIVLVDYADVALVGTVRDNDGEEGAGFCS
jgi:hypothetical protein